MNRLNDIQSPHTVSDWFHVPGWRQRSLPVSYTDQHELPCQNWLIFKDSAGLGRNFSESLSRMNQNVLTVESGSQFKQLNDQAFAMTVDDSSHYHQLLTRLQQQNFVPDHIVHFWNIAVVHMDELTFESENLLGFQSLLYLMQAIRRHRISHPMQLAVISTHLYKITGYEPFKPAKAPIIGLIRNIPGQFPDISIRTVDIQLPQSIHEPIEELSRQLVAEFIDQREDELVAFRGVQRWTLETIRTRFKRTDLKNGLLKEHGLYIINNGLSTDGLLVASYLVNHLPVRLIILDEIDLQAEDVIEGQPDGQSDSLRQKTAALRTISEQAESFEYRKSEPDQFKKILEGIHSGSSHIDGIIQAGATDLYASGKDMSQITEQDWKDFFRRRVDPVRAVAEMVQVLRPDFVMMLCQNGQSTLSDAADAYLKALAFQYCGYIGVNWTSLVFHDQLSGNFFDFTTPAADQDSAGLLSQILDRVFSSRGFPVLHLCPDPVTGIH